MVIGPWASSVRSAGRRSARRYPECKQEVRPGARFLRRQRTLLQRRVCAARGWQAQRPAEGKGRSVTVLFVDAVPPRSLGSWGTRGCTVLARANGSYRLHRRSSKSVSPKPLQDVVLSCTDRLEARRRERQLPHSSAGSSGAGSSTESPICRRGCRRWGSPQRSNSSTRRRCSPNLPTCFQAYPHPSPTARCWVLHPRRDDHRGLALRSPPTVLRQAPDGQLAHPDPLAAPSIAIRSRMAVAVAWRVTSQLRSRGLGAHLGRAGK